MQAQDQWQEYVQAGKQAVRKGSVAARQIVGKVAAEAARRAHVAQPVIAETCRKTRTEFQQQVKLAKPILQSSAREAAAAVRDVSQVASSAAWSVLSRTPRKVFFGVAVGLCGMSALALTIFPESTSKSSVVQSSPLDLPSEFENAAPVEPELPSNVEPSEPAPISRQNSVREVASSWVDPAQLQRQQREQELAQRLQRAQFELEQAEADYNYAVEQWNAEVQACQQGSLPPGYTPQQMGRFAAMGVRMQPRQPNQALLYAAQQAEQRYLQARDNFQRVANAQ